MPHKDTIEEIVKEFEESFIFFNGVLRKKIRKGEYHGSMGGNASAADIKKLLIKSFHAGLQRAGGMLKEVIEVGEKPFYFSKDSPVETFAVPTYHLSELLTALTKEGEDKLTP